MKLLRSNWPILALIFIILIFFRPALAGQLPIPGDTIVGLYHPFRDLYRDQYPNGIPFKNFLVTDPVRQQYPFRELSIDLFKKGELPFWNPYNMAGAPLLANFQSAVFYPLNVLFFFFPFAVAWSILILSQPFLGGLFMYLYLRNLGLLKVTSFLGALAFSFSGFSVAWLTWGTIGHVILWLPLILLGIDKIVKTKNYLFWSAIFILALVSSFFAGHLQTFFYIFMVSVVYLLVRWWQSGRNRKLIPLFIIHYSLFIILTAVQWLPTLQLILESARNLDQTWQGPGWFIPLQNLAQFFAPDFFGNPATLNYFGVWNYAEFIGYIGILPLLFCLYAIFWRRDKKTLFFGSLVLLGLIFSVQNPLSELPYRLNIPFLSTSQPTRLLAVIDFSLGVLAALGFDLFLRKKEFKRILYILLGFVLIFLVLWLVALSQGLVVSQRNLILPTGLFILSSLFIFVLSIFSKGKKATLILFILLVLVVFDLLRFAEKFTPFTKKEYLFPETKIIEFLENKEKEEGPFRLMTTDDRIFPPNFSIIYKLQSVDGYDPLYSRRYGELIAASERGEPNINPPFGFNRIIAPKNIDSPIVDLLGVKYILSLSDLSSKKLTKVFQEGETRVYENKNALPRVFFIEQTYHVADKQEAIEVLFRSNLDLGKVTVIEIERSKNKYLQKMQPPLYVLDAKRLVGSARILSYSENKIEVEINNPQESGLLVLTDMYYPTWRAIVDSDYELPILRVDYTFRGVSVPKGKHIIKFFAQLL